MDNDELANFAEEEYVIRDNAGSAYTVRFLRSEDLWDIRVLHDGREIGEANCPIHGESLYLGNIEFFGAANPPAAVAGGAAAQPAAPTYRGRGLGKALLLLIIDQARRSGTFRQITGILHPQNLQDTPHLPEWYRRHGFEVRMTPDGRGGTIRFDLNRDEGEPGGT